jgi:hypothetical protein
VSCPSRRRLAAASAGEDVAIERHAETCAQCRAELDAVTELIALARHLPAPGLAEARRTMIGIAALGASDPALPKAARNHRAARGTWIAAIALGATMVALTIGFLARRDREAAPRDARVTATARPGIVVSPTARHPDGASPEAAPVAAVASPAVAPDPPAAPPPRSRGPASARREVTHLPDGAVTIDARNTAPVHIVAGDTAVQIAASKVEVTAHGGVVTMVRVFAGSVEIERTAHRAVIVAGEVWVRPAPTVDAAAASLRAFEVGWLALRDARYHDAVAAFDRASDPVVAEDAAYWAAIASERAGDRSHAIRRLRGFVVRFPASVHADDVRRALAVLAP